MDFEEWPLDADGFPHRDAARCVIFNAAGQIFLVRGHDIDRPESSWWFTPGGGLEPGEEHRTGLARELREETGLDIDVSRFIGPVLQRNSTFYFAAKTRKQDELYYLLHLDARESQEIFIGATLTELEKEVLDEMRWWDLDELAQLAGPVYPRGLAEYASSWFRGWDGNTKVLVEL